MSDDMTVGDAVEHLDRCSYADDDDICGRAIRTLREELRATTTANDDRGRELARIADDLELVADQMNGQMRGRAAAKWRRDAQTIRSLAAPAEAGDEDLPELWWHRDHGVLLPTVADGVDYGWHVLGSSTWLDVRPRGAVRLAATPLAPEGGQG